MGETSSGLKTFVVDSVWGNLDAIATRSYIGADLQFVYESPIGTTTLRGEFIQGQQPVAGKSNTTSPSTVTKDLVTGLYPDTYIRNCQGAVMYFVQNIKAIKSGLVLKYDWYDPNTDVTGTDIGAKDANGKTGNLTKSDIKYTTLGLGYLLYINANTKFGLYRDIVTNEATMLKGWTQDNMDNVWTLRLQFKF